MAQSQSKKSVQKITLSSSCDIPFDKLVLSQSNVRHIKAGMSIEELADDIARRTLIQSIMVRPVRDAEGAETGIYEIPAGGRRYRALALLVKQRRLVAAVREAKGGQAADRISPLKKPGDGGRGGSATRRVELAARCA